VTVRTQEELAWIHVHKEAGARATLQMGLARLSGAAKPWHAATGAVGLGPEPADAC